MYIYVVCDHHIRWSLCKDSVIKTKPKKWKGCHHLGSGDKPYCFSYPVNGKFYCSRHMEDVLARISAGYKLQLREKQFLSEMGKSNDRIDLDIPPAKPDPKSP